jgi:nucleotide-binding universal stress UspA family protein
MSGAGNVSAVVGDGGGPVSTRRIVIKRILCPTDFSEYSARAVRQAARVARRYDAEIQALHVWPVSTAPWAESAPERDRGQEVSGPRILRALDDLLAPAAAGGVRTTSYAAEGDAAAVILDHAVQQDVDLIIMGTHGRAGFQRLTLGAVTEKVLRRAECPVLTVCHGDGVGRGAVPFQEILCAVDFSPPAEHALSYALSLAEEARANLTLLHVVEPTFDFEASKDSRLSVEEHWRYLQYRAKARLENAVPAEARHWCRVETRVAMGRPWEEIVIAAQEGKADLVVMGVHGRSSIQLAVFGSTTHQLVRLASCPVLTVHLSDVAEAFARRAATAATE